MELFEKVDSVAHYNFQDSNGGPLNFVKIYGELLGPNMLLLRFGTVVSTVGWNVLGLQPIGVIFHKYK
jgi:hypothetical protein